MFTTEELNTEDALSLSGILTKLHIPSPPSPYKPTPGPCHGIQARPTDPLRSLLVSLGIVQDRSPYPVNPVWPNGRVEILPHDSSVYDRFAPNANSEGKVISIDVVPKLGVDGGRGGKALNHFWDPSAAYNSRQEVNKHGLEEALAREYGSIPNVHPDMEHESPLNSSFHHRYVISTLGPSSS
jgi:hypothetical protein